MYDYLENPKKTRIAIYFNIFLLIFAILSLFLLRFHLIGSLIIIVIFIIGQIVLLFSLNRLSNVKQYIFTHPLIFASLSVILLRTFMTLAHAFLRLNTLSNYAALIVCLCFFIISLISISTYWYVYNEFKFEKLFMLLALLFGTILLFVFPSYTVADEPQHIYTAYHFSNRILGLPVSDKGLYMRQDDADYVMRYPDFDINDFNAYLSQLVSPLKNDEIVLVQDEAEYTQTIEYLRRPLVIKTPFYQYLPISVGFAIARILHFNTVSTFLLGRFMNLLAYIVMIYFSIKYIPIGKALLFTISLMPEPLHLAASASRDISRIGLATLCVSLTLYLFYSKEENSNKTPIIITLVISSLLLLPLRSYVYFPICILPIFIYLYRKKIISTKMIIISAMSIFALIIFYVIFKTFLHPDNIVNEPVRRLGWDTAPGYSIEYFINHPIYLITIIRTTIIERSMIYINQLVGSSLGWLYIPVPDTYIFIVEIIVLLSVFTRDYEKIQLPLILRTALFVGSFATILFINIGMAVTWTRAGIFVVEGLQGRYFLPITLPFLLTFKGKNIILSGKADLLNICLMIVVMIIITQTLMLRLL